jgi:multiple sugar transport system substrate-binding protein
MRGFPIRKFCLMLLTALLFSCGGGQEDQTSKKVHLTVMMWKPRIPEAWQELFRRFQEVHPDIRLVVEIGPQSSTALHDMLSQRLKNRSTDVDVFFMDVVWPPEFASAGWAHPLDEYFPQEERAKFLPGPIMANTFQGRIYGVPLFMDSGMLFYRSDLLSKYRFKPPATWQELVSQAVTIVEGERGQGGGLYGYSAQFKQYEGLVCNMLEFILSNNGRLLSDPDEPCALMQEAALEALVFVRDQIIRRLSPEGILTYEEPESMEIFLQGRVIFHRNWPYVWEVANDPKQSRIVGKVSIAPLPHFPNGKSHSALGGWQLAISAFSKNKDAAWRFVEFLTSEPSQRYLALKAGRAPTLISLYDDPEVLSKMPHLSMMKRAFIDARPRPLSPLYPAVSNILQYFFHRVISGSAKDIRAEARNACMELRKILALQRKSG